MKVFKLTNTSVANTVDLGDEKNIQSKDKLPVSHRLALFALRNTLEQENGTQGPMEQNVEIKGNELVLHLTNAADLKTLNGQLPSAFCLTVNLENGDLPRRKFQTKRSSYVQGTFKNYAVYDRSLPKNLI